MSAKQLEAYADPFKYVRVRELMQQLDACFCDDCGQYPECDRCTEARIELADLQAGKGVNLEHVSI